MANKETNGLINGHKTAITENRQVRYPYARILIRFRDPDRYPMPAPDDEPWIALPKLQRRAVFFLDQLLCIPTDSGTARLLGDIRSVVESIGKEWDKMEIVSAESICDGGQVQ